MQLKILPQVIKKTLTQVIPFAVYEVITNHPLLREVEYESFEEVGK